MKKYLKQLLMTTVMLNAALCYSQQISVHSPTAANLGLYGEIPMSYYTGTPNISIPLYEIKGTHVTVPVELSYHPAGIRPEIHPGPVGLGWSLRAGGVISRTVRGRGPDESDTNGRIGIVNGYLNYAYAGGWMAQTDWKNHFKNSIEGNCNECRYLVRGSMALCDIEPDEFNFSVLDISGKFYFDHTGQIQVQCDNPVKVIFNNEFVQPWNEGIELDYSYNGNMHRAFKSFTIIDEHGTQYYFGGASAIEFSDPISYGRGSNGYGIPATGELLQATSWFLTQIKSADGADIISFTYERGPFVSQLYRSYNSYSYSGYHGSGWVTTNIEKDGTLISPVYLKSITCSNGVEITFSYTQSNDIQYSNDNYISLFHHASADDYKLLGKTGAIPRFQPFPPSNKYDRIQWLKLDTICVRMALDANIRLLHLIYNNNSSERLFLESLKIYGENWLIPPMNYTFSYKNKNRLPAQYLTCITDHWGFNNGKTYPSNGFNSQYKSPDAYYTNSGVLSEIKYPTGGTTQFEYELHDYDKVVNTKNRSVITNQSGLASGLRIKKIITNHLTENTVTREFFYRETPTSSTSSGILNMLPQYFYSVSGKDCDNKSFSMSFTRSMPVIPLTKDNEGLYIGYTYVCEQVSNGNSGYTQYHYTNHDNGHSDVLLPNGKWHRDIFPSDPHCSRYFERGRLKKETFYNAEGQTVAVNETVWNRYGSQGEDNPRALFFEGLMVGYDYCSTAAYLHYCYKFLPSQKTKTVYNSIGQNPVVTITDYSYNAKNLLSQTSVLGSDGKKQTTKMVYPFEIIEGPDTAVLRKMTEKNMLSSHIEKVSYLENGKVIDGEYRKFNETAANSKIFKPEKIYLLPKSGSTTVGNLYPVSGKDINFYLESGMHPPEIIRMTDTFTVKKYPSKIIINMSLCQEPQYIGYFPISICFVISIKKSGGGTPYYVEAADNIYGRFANNMYYYDRTDTLELQPGTYIVDFTHRGRFNTDFTHLNVGHLGSLNVSFRESTPTMAASYPSFKPEMSYKYNSKGNIIEAKHEGNQISTAYLWGYKNQYPIAEIRNATYEQVESVLGRRLIRRIEGSVPPASADWNAINSLRGVTVFPNTEITTYTYKPLIGIETVTDPSGNEITYEYDAFGRLERIRDADGNVLENTEYHYAD
ncbi:MAG: RHS repeat protein [Prevotellaceae bacterium]|nr:RHS repeat protein [Prevotellaceae bacterium]